MVYPPAAEMTVLWKKSLRNVHPLVTIFFDWEIEIIMHRVAQDQTRLTRGEQALVFAVYFIATMSLSEGECVYYYMTSGHNILTGSKEPLKIPN